MKQGKTKKWKLSSGAEKRLRRSGRFTISYSIAYTRVCEWIYGSSDVARPSLSMLDEAEVHAVKLKDDYILEAIEVCRRHWVQNEKKDTPKLPPPFKASPKKRKSGFATRPYCFDPIIEIRPQVAQPVDGQYRITSATSMDRDLDDIIEGLDRNRS